MSLVSSGECSELTKEDIIEKSSNSFLTFSNDAGLLLYKHITGLSFSGSRDNPRRKLRRYWTPPVQSSEPMKFMRIFGEFKV